MKCKSCRKQCEQCRCCGNQQIGFKFNHFPGFQTSKAVAYDPGAQLKHNLAQPKAKAVDRYRSPTDSNPSIFSATSGKVDS
ncbi:hypothetical protein QO005_001019 [Rhizobium paknamense]|uniref:Uncharacterized protein n=1 Tax=Rhizobium paknamense TaxID=1206817 RepID=A0ABU0I905_9HYPH|nr:hypothetical protein [Rhizobium paknamense]